jgi:hypothetical protein
VDCDSIVENVEFCPRERPVPGESQPCRAHYLQLRVRRDRSACGEIDLSSGSKIKIQDAPAVIFSWQKTNI